MLATIALVLTVTPLAWAEMSLTIDEMTVNGQVMQNLSCKMSKGGFLTTTVLVATIAQQKKALDRCGPQGEAFDVAFTWSGGKTTNVEVRAASREKGKQCVAKAFQKMRPSLEGSCTAIVLTGKTDAAKAAAAKLRATGGGTSKTGTGPSSRWIQVRPELRRFAAGPLPNRQRFHMRSLFRSVFA
jgi:hypothetical protein